MENQPQDDRKNEKKMGHADRGPASSHFYEIHVKERLDPIWTDWLEGMQMRCSENGHTTLSGALPDQAALMGVLNMLNRLNLTILSVRETHRRGAELSAGSQPARDQ